MPVPTETLSHESPLNEAVRKLQSMDDIHIDAFQEFAEDSIIDPVPLYRIFRSEEAWERRSAP